MIVQQFFVKGLAHSSYLLGGSEECAIVDPRRDIEIYLEAADALGMKITRILETHLHADFISGHMDLAEQTGAQIYAPRSAACAFPHTAVAEGDAIRFEHLQLDVLETPGHTPEHISYVTLDTSRGSDPVGLFCGDTLFVGDVGRPDLFPGQARELAEKLHASLHEKLLCLPDFCEVYPAHGAGSLCGRAMGAKRTSTIGYERRFNAALQIENVEDFIASLTTDMPAAPDHFSRCSDINGAGPQLVRALPGWEPLAPQVFARRAEDKACLILDVRGYEAFGGHHCPGAYHIDLGGNFATFAGWVVPPDVDMLLVGDNEAQLLEASILLRRVGLDRIAGYLEGGMFAWARAGLPTGHVRQISAVEMHAMVTGADPLHLVDVRAVSEFESAHIEGAINIPAPEIRTRFDELDRRVPVALTCGTGHRSSMAASILLRHGFQEVINVGGGMMGYSAAGFTPACPICMAPHGPRAPQRDG